MKTSRTLQLIGALVIFFGLSLNNQLFAQAQYKLNGKTELKVLGTSTIHDWEMVAAQSQGTAEMIVTGNSLSNVKSASVTMKTEALKSGKDKMDEIAHETLKSNKHPEIRFTLTSFKKLEGNKGQATGNLTIAGTTKPVIFNVETTVKGGQVSLSGEAGIKFSEFNLKAPTAMLGTIKTGNDLKLKFIANFQAIAI